MILKTKIILTLLAINLTACSNSDSKPSSTSHHLTNSEELANVIIYRPAQSVMLSATRFSVYVDDSYIGTLRNNSRFALKLPQGQHRVWVNDKAKSQIDINIGAEDTLYLQGTVVNKQGYRVAWKKQTSEHGG